MRSWNSGLNVLERLLYFLIFLILMCGNEAHDVLKENDQENYG